MYPHSTDSYLLNTYGENPVQGAEDLQETVDFIHSFDEPITYVAEGRISEVSSELEEPEVEPETPGEGEEDRGELPEKPGNGDQGEDLETSENENGESVEETESSLDGNDETVNQQENKKGNLLPKTATMTYNLIIVGLILFVIEFSVFYTNNRRKA